MINAGVTVAMMLLIMQTMAQDIQRWNNNREGKLICDKVSPSFQTDSVIRDISAGNIDW